MSRRVISAALVAGALLLTACGMSAGSFERKLPDGRTVQCIDNNGHGVTCDWDRAK